jgi:hypothetical protein
MDRKGNPGCQIGNVSQETEIELYKVDHLCGIVVRVPGYRSRGPGSIPGATRFSSRFFEK